ncbi:MAG: hypothetical protein C3F08_05375 [Candidatus Methylomirabilota bacterium]|nr:MAG: hypothetical protein C3F08_05375 [candidate division NC10 bacterium]
MVQSKDILDLLDLLDETGLDIGFLWGFVHDESREGGQLSPFSHSEDPKAVKEMRGHLRALVKSKQGTVIGRDELIQKLLSVVEDGHLDETITRCELQEVPGIIARRKKLRTISTASLPDKKVTAYLRQATTCYLYGLTDAAAALCRSVLRFALEEAMAKPGGVNLGRISHKDYLYNLIEFARKTKSKNIEILPDPLPQQAHEIREVGNNALHASGFK